MYYTIGNKAVYNALFNGVDTPMKAGRTKDYEGGIVWDCPQDALYYLEGQSTPMHIDFGDGPVECAVYGVAVFEEDVSTEAHAEVSDAHYLLKDGVLSKVYGCGYCDYFAEDGEKTGWECPRCQST